MPSISKLQPVLAFAAILGPAFLSRSGSAGEAPAPPPAGIARLAEVYPQALERIDGNWLVWRDGTRMEIDDGRGVKPFAAWLEAPDIEDMLRVPYPAGADASPPPSESDPGRARNQAFFEKMYGDCRKGGVEPRLETVVWLPKKRGQRLRITGINGVTGRLAAVSRELDALPASFDKFLFPAAGTYNCRPIAGTGRPSAHGFGIAIDLATGMSDYWRWGVGTAGDAASESGAGKVAYRNRIPLEIVRIFERQGFIWGGRWHHYDTMHFEYRPELLPALEPMDSK